MPTVSLYFTSQYSRNTVDTQAVEIKAPFVGVPAGKSLLNAKILETHRPSVTRQQWFDSHQDGSTDPLDLLALTQSLQSLEVEDLEILVAHIWTGLSFRQIADSFALSLTMVHRRYHAALKQLRVVMDGNQLEHKYTDLTQACSLRPSEAKYHE